MIILLVVLGSLVGGYFITKDQKSSPSFSLAKTSAPAREGAGSLPTKEEGEGLPARLSGVTGNAAPGSSDGPVGLPQEGGDAGEGLAHYGRARFDNPGDLPLLSERPARAVGGDWTDPELKRSRLSMSEPKGLRIDGPVPRPSPERAEESSGKKGRTLTAAWQAAGAPLGNVMKWVQKNPGNGIVDIMGRREWDPSPTTHSSVGNPRKITIHHTVGHEVHSDDEMVQQMRNIESGHKKKWKDIGYNYTIGNGKAAEGRGPTALGAHTEDNNTRNLGVAFLGNYISKPPNGPDVLAFINLATEMAIKYDMDIESPDFIRGHVDYKSWSKKKGRWINNKDCPGKYIKDMIPQIRGIVVRKVREGRVA